MTHMRKKQNKKHGAVNYERKNELVDMQNK